MRTRTHSTDSSLVSRVRSNCLNVYLARFLSTFLRSTSANQHNVLSTFEDNEGKSDTNMTCYITYMHASHRTQCNALHSNYSAFRVGLPDLCPSSLVLISCWDQGSYRFGALRFTVGDTSAPSFRLRQITCTWVNGISAKFTQRECSDPWCA